MNYRDTNNHNYRSLLNYASPITRQLFPAILVFGFLSLIQNLTTKEVFLSGIAEFMASFSLPFSLALSIFFCGLTLIFKNTNAFLVNIIQKLTAYWSTFSISLSAATLGIVAGLFIPFICTNGIWPSIAFLCIGLMTGMIYGGLAHHIAILAFTANLENFEKYRNWFGLAFSVLGIALGLAAVETQWSKLNGF
ncbi:MAG: hypothetical protein KBT75_14920 [Oleispira antarctica]|nr:hypothetical protein [Oleispira antarctica]